MTSAMLAKLSLMQPPIHLKEYVQLLKIIWLKSEIGRFTVFLSLSKSTGKMISPSMDSIPMLSGSSITGIIRLFGWFDVICSRSICFSINIIGSGCQGGDWLSFGGGPHRMLFGYPSRLRSMWWRFLGILRQRLGLFPICSSYLELSCQHRWH